MRGLVHIGITVRDFDAMLAFYTNVLGLEVGSLVPHPRGGRKACLRGADAEVIELISYPNPKPHQGRDRSRTGIHHFGFVVDDVRRHRERLVERGVELDGDINPNAKGELVQHFWDPEGNRVHLTEQILQQESTRSGG